MLTVDTVVVGALKTINARQRPTDDSRIRQTLTYLRAFVATATRRPMVNLQQLRPAGAGPIHER